jgi:YfiH family protein
MTPALPTWDWRRRGGLTVLGWPALDQAGVDVAVTTRHGGVSSGPYRSLNLGLHVGDRDERVLENRRRAAGAVGAGLDELVVGAQVHGDRAAVVTGADRGRGAAGLDDALPDTDALVTAEPGVVLVTMVADCVPVVLVDPVARVLATVHAGWRGTAAGIVRRALDVMSDLGCRPGDVVAGIGPAVARDRYQVGPEVAEALGTALGPEAAAEVVADDGPGHWRADLVAANRLMLERAGVPAAQIVGPPCPTGPPGPFFSDRARRPCGRFALLAVRRT